MHILKRAAIRIDEYAKETVRRWVNDTYKADCDSPNGYKAGLFAAFTSAAASTGIEYLDNKFRKIFTRILQDPRLPLLAEQDLRKGAVFFAIGSLGPGGSERQVVLTLRGLLDAGYSDLSLVCVYLDGAPFDFYKHLLDGTLVRVAQLRKTTESWKHGVACNGADLAALANLTEVLASLPPELRYVEFFARELLERKPEIVHTWLDDVNVMAGIAAAIVGVPKIVISTRSVAPPNFPLFQPYMREAYRALADLPNVSFLNNSEAGARDYERWLKLPRGTFRIIPNGFDFSCLNFCDRLADARKFRAWLGVPEPTPLVGSVLRFSEEKRPFLWVEAVVRVSRRIPDTRFLLVGDGPLKKQVERLAQKLGIGDRLFLLGHQRDALAAMAAMDVFMLTSRLEGLPNVLIEAQALGVPVVTTDAGGAAETLLPGSTGFAVKPHDPDLLSEAVVKILENSGWRDKARVEAPKFVCERFGLERMIRDTLHAYRIDGRENSGGKPPLSRPKKWAARQRLAAKELGESGYGNSGKAL